MSSRKRPARSAGVDARASAWVEALTADEVARVGQVLTPAKAIALRLVHQEFLAAAAELEAARLPTATETEAASAAGLTVAELRRLPPRARKLARNLAVTMKLGADIAARAARLTDEGMPALARATGELAAAVQELEEAARVSYNETSQGSLVEPTDAEVSQRVRELAEVARDEPGLTLGEATDRIRSRKAAAAALAAGTAGGCVFSPAISAPLSSDARQHLARRNTPPPPLVLERPARPMRQQPLALVKGSR